jgi:hypothetical protein
MFHAKLLICLAPVCVFIAFANANETHVIVRGSAQNAPKQPQIAVDESGAIHVTYGVGKAVYYCKSSDKGETFTGAVKIGEVPGLALGMRRGPRIVVAKEALVVTAIGHKDGNLYAWRSTDGGQHWSHPVQVNDSSRDAREGLHAMAKGPGENIYVVWLDCRDQKRGSRIYGAASTDSGKTWTANREVYHSPSGSVCECCHPSLAFGPLGQMYVMWRNSVNGSRDMYMTSSVDGGRTFSDAVKLGSGTWPLDACPMDGGYIAVSAKDGRIFTAWRRSNEVFRTASDKSSEERLGTGTQPWIAASSAGPYVVWLEKRPGRLVLQSPSESEPKQLAAQAVDPVIASGPGGAGPIVAVWERPEANATALVCQVLEMNK